MTKQKFFLVYDEIYNRISTLDLEEVCERVLADYCECGEGYDVLDRKTNEMMCSNCYYLNNFGELSSDEMLQISEGCGYTFIEMDRTTIKNIHDTITDYDMCSHEGVSLIHITLDTDENEKEYYYNFKVIYNNGDFDYLDSQLLGTKEEVVQSIKLLEKHFNNVQNRRCSNCELLVDYYSVH